MELKRRKPKEKIGDATIFITKEEREQLRRGEVVYKYCKYRNPCYYEFRCLQTGLIPDAPCIEKYTHNIHIYPSKFYKLNIDGWWGGKTIDICVKPDSKLNYHKCNGILDLCKSNVFISEQVGYDIWDFYAVANGVKVIKIKSDWCECIPDIYTEEIMNFYTDSEEIKLFLEERSRNVKFKRP